MLEIIIYKYFRDFFQKIKEDKKLKKIFILAIFLLNLSIYSIPLYLFHNYIIVISKDILNNFAYFLYLILKNIIDISINGNILVVKNLYFVVDQSCIGLKSILAIFSIIFATPITKYNIKIKYFLMYIPILFFLNIIRIVSTIFLFYFYNINVYFVHDILWEIFTTLAIIILWLIFYRKNKEYLLN